MLIWDPHIHLFWYKPGIELVSTGYLCSRDRLGSRQAEAEAKCCFPSRTQLAVSKSTPMPASLPQNERSPEDLPEAQLTEMRVFVQRHWPCRKQVNSSISHLSQETLKSRCNPAGLPRRGSLILLPPSLPCKPPTGFLTWAGGQTDRQTPACGQQPLEKGGIPGTGGHSCSRGSYISLAIAFLTQASAGKHQGGWDCRGPIPVVGEELPKAGHLPGTSQDVPLVHPWETHFPKAQCGSHLAEILKPLLNELLQGGGVDPALMQYCTQPNELCFLICKATLSFLSPSELFSVWLLYIGPFY